MEVVLVKTKNYGLCRLVEQEVVGSYYIGYVALQTAEEMYAIGIFDYANKEILPCSTDYYNILPYHQSHFFVVAIINGNPETKHYVLEKNTLQLKQTFSQYPELCGEKVILQTIGDHAHIGLIEYHPEHGTFSNLAVGLDKPKELKLLKSNEGR